MHANLKILRHVRKNLSGRTTVWPWLLETLVTGGWSCCLQWGEYRRAGARSTAGRGITGAEWRITHREKSLQTTHLLRRDIWREMSPPTSRLSLYPGAGAEYSHCEIETMSWNSSQASLILWRCLFIHPVATVDRRSGAGGAAESRLLTHGGLRQPGTSGHKVTSTKLFAAGCARLVSVGLPANACAGSD